MVKASALHDPEELWRSKPVLNLIYLFRLEMFVLGQNVNNYFALMNRARTSITRKTIAHLFSAIRHFFGIVQSNHSNMLIPMERRMMVRTCLNRFSLLIMVVTFY